MGKASSRRKARRQAYMGRLAQENPEKFWMEWSKRLESWSKEAGRRSRLWRDAEGHPLPKAFSLIEAAMKELQRCGQKAVELEGAETRAIMSDSCCRAVARAYDHRLYRLGAKWARKTKAEGSGQYFT